MGKPLIEQSIQFSVDMVRYCKWLREEKREFILSNQVLRSAPSIGANIHEGNFAVSKADFIAKMQIALKEAYETQYWLIVLEQTEYLPEQFVGRKEQCAALLKMLVATLNTSKK